MDELELERQRRIRENRQRLNELQLTELAKDLAVENHAQGGVHPARSDSICELAQIKFKQFETPYVQPGCFQTEDVASYRTTASGSRRSLYAGDDTQKKARKREKKEKKENEPPAAPTRASRRMQGIAADLPVGLGMGGAIDAKLDDEAVDLPDAGRARSRIRFPDLPSNSVVCAPFTLRSIRTTIWDVGQVHRGSFSHRYWSSKGCLYHHAYPVGFRASKTQFGRAYTMHISADDVGPVFRVVDDANGEEFSGESPTKPWTDVCLAKKAGTRISGPQFFGFSDPITIRAIAALYSPEELDACRRGETVASAAPSVEELAVQEFARVEGIGERTAIALARTAALPGAPLRSLGALQAVARADGGAALLLFLTESPEIPEATRRWPLWKKRIAQAVVAALLSDDPTASSRPPPKERKGKARAGTPAVEAGGAGVAAAGGDAAHGGGAAADASAPLPAAADAPQQQLAAKQGAKEAKKGAKQAKKRAAEESAAPASVSCGAEGAPPGEPAVNDGEAREAPKARGGKERAEGCAGASEGAAVRPAKRRKEEDADTQALDAAAPGERGAAAAEAAAAAPAAAMEGVEEVRMAAAATTAERDADGAGPAVASSPPPQQRAEAAAGPQQPAALPASQPASPIPGAEPKKQAGAGKAAKASSSGAKGPGGGKAKASGGSAQPGMKTLLHFFSKAPAAASGQHQGTEASDAACAGI